MRMLRVGCSGWSYADWRGPVYPEGAPASTWFARYAEQFDTVELNNTFYRLPRPRPWSDGPRKPHRASSTR